MSPETPGSDISVGSFWYWSIIVIFFVVLIYSLIFHVYPTFKDNGGKDWKIFGIRLN